MRTDRAVELERPWRALSCQPRLHSELRRPPAHTGWTKCVAEPEELRSVPRRNPRPPVLRDAHGPFLKHLELAVTLVLAVAAAPTALAAGFQVWTVTECARVLRSAPPGVESSVELHAARNEWESFQVLLRSDAPVEGVSLVAGDLTGPGGAALEAADARLFRQHQLELTVASYRNDAFEADWYPDPLIPFRHPATREPLTGARLTAAPFALPAGQTHGFWVDVFVPADARPGVYGGVYRVTAAGREAIQIPVQLTVWDFALPRVSAYRTAFGSPAGRMRSYYAQREKQGKETAPSDWTAVETQCAELLTRHRINATPWASMSPVRQPDGSYRIPSEQVASLREFVDRYHVNAFRTPRPTGVVKDPEKERDKLHAWLRAWDRAAAELDRPEVVFHTYLRDEPNDEEAYRFVQTWGRAICAAKSVVKVLVVEQTWPQKAEWGDLYGAIDIWCPLFPLFKAESAASRQALGETVWTYTALSQRSPMSPWWAIDHPLLHYRVPAWISWRYRIRGLLYWGGMAFWRQVEDPWTDPETLDRRQEGRETHVWNGEGSIVYPGRAVGYDGIASSLRLQALRDAIEDYEYLAILERAGLATQAEKVVLPLAASWFEWERDARAYETARRELAELILSSGKVP